MPTYQYTCQDCSTVVQYEKEYRNTSRDYNRSFCKPCRKIRQTKNALKHYHSKRDEINPIKKRIHKESRAMVVERLGGKCECCGESNPMFLEVDHVNDDGKEQRIKYPGQATIYWWLTKHNFPPGFRLLCCNCNKGRWRNGGMCPHQEGSQARAEARSSKRSEVPEILTTQDQDMVVTQAKAGAIQFEDKAGNIYWPLVLN